MVGATGIEPVAPAVSRQCFRLRLLKLLAFPLLESRRVTICSRVFGASGTGNCLGIQCRTPPRIAAGQLPVVKRLVAAVPEVSQDDVQDQLPEACHRLSGIALPM